MVERDNHGRSYGVSRRQAIASIGATGIMGLAGCTGGGGRDDNSSDTNGGGGDDGGGGDKKKSITMMTAQKESAAYATSQGIAAVINGNSDNLQLTAKPTDGTLQTMALLNKGETTFGYTDVLNAYDIVNNEGPYKESPLDMELQQCWHYYDLQGGFATHPDTDIKTIKDFKGKTIGWGPTAGSFHKNLRAHLGHALDTENDMKGQDSQFGKEPSALKEGRYDAVTELRVNREIVPSYDQEQHSINSNQRFVAWPKDTVDKIKKDSSLSGKYFAEEEIAGTVGWAGDVTEPKGKMWFPMTVYHMFTRADADGDIVYNLMKTMYENGSELASYHPVAKDWNKSDFQFWADGLVDWIPLHEGAARFYEEVGLELPDGVSTS